MWTEYQRYDIGVVGLLELVSACMCLCEGVCKASQRWIAVLSTESGRRSWCGYFLRHMVEQTGSTALNWTCEKGHVHAVAALLEAGASVSVANKVRCTL